MARRTWLRYAVALASALAAFAVHMLVGQVTRQLPFATFYAAVALTAWLAGAGPALLTTVTSALLVAYFVFLPVDSLGMHRDDAVRIAFFLAVSGVIIALARRKSQAEERAAEAKEQLAAIVESSDVAVVGKDARGIITAWNRGAERLYGYSAAEAMGKPISLVMPAEAPNQMPQVMAALRRGQRIERAEEERVRKDGSRVTVSLVISPIHNSHGEVVGASAIAHDITERKRAEQDLAASYERWQLAQQTARIGAWEWNLGSGRVAWSAELEKLHGLPPGSFDGSYEGWVATVHPEDREWVQREAMAAVQEMRPYDVEYRSVRPDGSTYWTAARGRVLVDAQGRPQRMIGVCMDIEARKRSEEALLRAEKLAATGRLAATIAHEINNPLESIMNLLFLARTNPQGVSQYIALAEEELERVAHISRQTLGFYRDTLAPAPFSVAEVLEQVLGVYARKMQSKNIRLEKRISDEGRVQGLAGEIRQVFSNLVANAVDAMPTGGRLTVKVTRARDWKDNGRAGVRVVVADNGCGIARAHTGNIFEPFFTTKPDVGTGLGLWLTRSMVHKHGGSISLRSSTQPGRSGTVFSVFLPGTAAEMPAAQSA